MARRSSRELIVRDVFQRDISLAVAVLEETPFLEVIRKFVERRDLRGIFVLDKTDRLTGVITRQDLLTWATLSLGLPSLERRFSWKHMFRLARATTASEACQPFSHLAAVRPSDPLVVALSNMVAHNLIDVPVVDAAGRILGDIRLSEVLTIALDREKARRNNRKG